MSEAEQPELARLTVELLSAYVANNTVQKDELAGLIETTRAALSGVSNDRRVARIIRRLFRSKTAWHRLSTSSALSTESRTRR